MNGKMLAQRLNQLNDLKAEACEIAARIDALENILSGDRWKKGCEQARAETIQKEMDALEGILNARRRDCMEESGRLIAFIDQAPDSKVRRILSARYLDGLLWREVAARIGETDEQVPRRIHNRYLEDCAKKVSLENHLFI